jgi:hypothetical protein
MQEYAEKTAYGLAQKKLTHQWAGVFFMEGAVREGR